MTPRARSWPARVRRVEAAQRRAKSAARRRYAEKKRAASLFPELLRRAEAVVRAVHGRDSLYMAVGDLAETVRKAKVGQL